MVDGTAVLCCDDAEKLTNYGNVFEIGIEKVWQNLRKEHNLIYSKQYSKEKQNLICNTCSRASFNWTSKEQGELIQEMEKEATKTHLQLVS
jgi:MoaA/NifB/PqqE/SkfB family radical SAM enzyme